MSIDNNNLIIELYLSGACKSISRKDLERDIENFQALWSVQALFDISKEYFVKGDIKRAIDYHKKSQNFIENL